MWLCLTHLHALCLLLSHDLLVELSVDEVAVLLLFLLDPVLEHMGQLAMRQKPASAIGVLQ